MGLRVLSPTVNVQIWLKLRCLGTVGIVMPGLTWLKLDGSNGVAINGNGRILGRSVSSAGDINAADGIDDLIVENGRC
jgi:hypothetical protein